DSDSHARRGRVWDRAVRWRGPRAATFPEHGRYVPTGWRSHGARTSARIPESVPEIHGGRLLEEPPATARENERRGTSRRSYRRNHEPTERRDCLRGRGGHRTGRKPDSAQTDALARSLACL